MTGKLLEAVRAMPKIELHRHLEGSLRLETLVDVARDYGIEMPEYEVETLRPFVQVTPSQPRSMQNFMSKFHTLRQFYLSDDIIKRMAHEVIVDAAEDNVKYFELRFTPTTLCTIVKCHPGDAIEWVCKTASNTARDYQIEVRYIISMNRHETLEIAEEVTDLAISLRDLGIVAIDLAGVEQGHPASKFKHVFKRGKDAGMYVTLHAGEWEGAQSVWDAVGNVGGVQRIGHGVRVVEDPALMSVLKDREIVLEVCPSSNVDSGAVAGFQQHPMTKLIEAGMLVTINTDDPLVSNITLSEELARAATHFGLTLDDLKHHTLVAANAAFLPDEERKALVKQFENWLYEKDQG